MVIEGKLPSSDKPVTIGHEATGEVLKVGSAVKGFKVGDNIGFINAYHACFSCEACSAHYTFCTSGKMVMQGFATNGYFQEYCVIDPGTAVVLPSKLDASTCAPIFCAGITAYNSMKAAKIKPGQWVAIVGCGGEFYPAEYESERGRVESRYAKNNR
jgi:propanol-preferring alcohol dehydrogenase